MEEEKREKRVHDLIERKKFLNNEKHHKYLEGHWAAHDSWAAQGTAGSCEACGVGHYNVTITHKRANGGNGKIAEICNKCYRALRKKVDLDNKPWEPFYK